MSVSSLPAKINKPDILYVTRPLVPPWNEGSIKLTWQLTAGMGCCQAHLLTAKGVSVPSSFAHIKWQRPYTDRHLNIQQKFRLLKYLWRLPEPIDILHFFFVPTMTTSVLLAYLTQRSGIPSVQTVPSLPRVTLSMSEAKHIFFADKIVTHTAETAVFLRNLGLKNVSHINVGIDVARYTPPPDFNRSILRKQLNLPQKGVLALYAGEYTRLGAVDQLRRIMPLVIDRCQEVHFVFACRILQSTDAGIKADLQKWVEMKGWSDRVRFLGEVPDFPALLHASDLFLFPATDMTGKIDTPLTLLEAMAAGLPVLAYEVHPLVEIFGEQKNVLLPIGDVEAMADAMIAQIQDRDRRQRQGYFMRQIVQERYSLQTMIAAYENLYGILT